MGRSLSQRFYFYIISLSQSLGHDWRIFLGKLPVVGFQQSRVQNSRQLILVFGGIYSSKTWMASHARKLFTSFAQAHARASFAQARNHASRESEKPRKPSPKTASRLHRASKSARKLRISSSRKVAQAPFEKLTARKLPLWSRKDGARISRKDE